MLAGHLDLFQIRSELIKVLRRRVLEKDFGVSDDRIQRSPQFVTHVRQEFTLGAACDFRGLFGNPEFFRSSAVGDVLRQDQFSRASAESYRMRTYFDLDAGSIFLASERELCCRSGFGGGRPRTRIMEWIGTRQIRYGHPEKFFPGVSVMQYSAVIHGQELQVFSINNPHRMRVRFKQRTVAFFAFAQDLLGAAVFGDLDL